jgi:hypothetical protein
MDIGWDSNDYDADKGKLNAGVHKDDDADILYGYRRSWRRTLYVYRGSCLLTPAQIMEQETYYRYAEVAVQCVTYILQLILLHQALYVTFHKLMGLSGRLTLLVAEVGGSNPCKTLRLE